jgi:fructose-bisphosphate aldolase class I
LPDNLPGVVFLSGGDSPEDSTSHLDALNEINSAPWQLSFSFGRALLNPALDAWQGKKENEEKAQKAFYERARLNSLARTGEY